MAENPAVVLPCCLITPCLPNPNGVPSITDSELHLKEPNAGTTCQKSWDFADSMHWHQQGMVTVQVFET